MTQELCWKVYFVLFFRKIWNFELILLIDRKKVNFSEIFFVKFFYGFRGESRSGWFDHVSLDWWRLVNFEHIFDLNGLTDFSILNVVSDFWFEWLDQHLRFTWWATWCPFNKQTILGPFEKPIFEHFLINFSGERITQNWII